LIVIRFKNAAFGRRFFFTSTNNMRSILLASGVFTVLAWLLPNKYPPWTSFYNDYCMFVALLFAWVYTSITAPPRISISYWMIGVIALILPPALQTLCGLLPFSGDGWVVVFYLAGFAGAIWLSALWPETRRPSLITGFAYVVLITSLLSLALALCQWLRISGLGIFAADLPPGGRPFANLAQPNNLATLLCLGLAAAIYLRTTQHFSRLSIALISGLLLLGIALTGSRTSLLVAGFTLVWTLWKLPQTNNRKPFLLWLSLGLAYYLFFFLFGIRQLFEWLLLTDAAGPARELAVDSNRLTIWKQSVAAIAHQPWFGYGWNQVSTAQVTVAASYPSHLSFGSSHNILLDLLLWNGIPIGLTIITATGYWLISRAIRASTITSWYALLSIGVLLIHGMLELPLEYAYFLLPLGFFCGVVEVEHPTKKTLILDRRWLWAPVAIGLFFLVWVWQEYRVIEEDYRLMRFETLRIGTLKADQAAPNVVLLSQLREDIRLARSQAHPDMTASELEAMRITAHRFPYYANLYRYSLALALNGRKDEATLEFKRMCNMYPAPQCPIAIEQIKRLADDKYPQLKAWKLP
jgi:O-antigen ligase